MFKDYYKFGVKFSMPLTFAQGRGDVRIANLKIREAKYDLELKRNELNNKLRSYYTELVVLKDQVNLYKATVTNYEKLYTGEVMRFNAGESNVFLVNTRENKWLEAQQKLAEVQLKYFKAEAALKWVMMQLN
jgi:outer membrane protein TolC